MKALGRFRGWAAALAVIVMVAGVFAQDRPKIAVYVTGDVPNNEKEALGTRILTSLVNSGRYMAIERSNAFLAEIDKEHIKQRSGAIDDSQISELGKQFGVKFVCIAAITPAFGDFQVSARIIDVETAVVVAIGDTNSPLESLDDLTDASNRIVAILFEGVTQVQQASTVLPAQKTNTMLMKKLFVPSRKLEKKTSIEIGGALSYSSYSYSYSELYYDDYDRKYNSDSIFRSGSGFEVGPYLRIDLTYFEAFINFYSDGTFSYVGYGNAGILAKYPIGNDVIKVSPLLGIGTIVDGRGHDPEMANMPVILGAKIDIGINDIAYLNSEYLYLILRLMSFRLGVGLDIDLGWGGKAYLRPELMYNLMYWSYDISDDFYEYAKLKQSRHFFELRLGIGIGR